MTDIFEPAKRREIMSSVKSKNSVAERIVFKYLRAHKIYFQKHYTGIIGKPDIALPRKKKAVFIDGDFWHGRDITRIREKHGEASFWTKKINGNIERDTMQRRLLNENGWGVLAIWESDLIRKRTREDALLKIARFLTVNRLPNKL